MQVQDIHLDIETFANYQRLILQGVINFYNRHRPTWRFTFDHWPANDRAMRIRSLRQVHGIISHNPTAAGLKAIRDRQVPVVLVEQKPGDVEFPIVNADNEKISKMALAHFRDKGLRRFGFAATSASWPANERSLAFKLAIEHEGSEPAHIFPVDQGSRLMDPTSRDAIRLWVAGLPKPIGIFCSSVGNAWLLVEACNELGIHVPDEVAVVGCDKDQLTPDLTHPPLSTVDHGMEQAGYDAALLLHQILEGKPPPSQPILVAPIGVIQRQSSDTLSIDDPNVADAVRFIRERSIYGITPGDVVSHVLIGRRRLEIRFNEVVGRTIQQQIMFERVEHARHLLANTELSLLEIANRSSFNHVSRLSEAFTRLLNVAPSQYRRQAQGTAD